MSTTVIARFQVKPEHVEAMRALLSSVQSKAIEAGVHSISFDSFEVMLAAPPRLIT